MKPLIILTVLLFLFVISDVYGIKVNLTYDNNGGLIDHEVMETAPNICDPSNPSYVGSANITNDHTIGYWKFNTALIPTNSIINDATLYLNLYSGYIDNYYMNLTVYHVYNQTWECITWDDQPCNNESQCNPDYESRYDGFGKFDTTLPTETYYNWAITDMFKNDYDNNNANFSVMMKSISNAPTNIWRFYSLNYANVFYRGYVEVDYTPFLAPSQIDFSKFNYIKQYGQILHNHNICVDNETLGHNITYTIKIDLNQSIVNVWVNEPCTFGCDNVTMSCRTSQIAEYSNYFLYLVGLVVIIGVVYWLYKRW